MSSVYLSQTAHPSLQIYLKKQGYTVEIVKKTPFTYDVVCSHPDIYMCSLNLQGKVFFGDSGKLTFAYPGNIIYNAACTGKFFIHNFKYTDPLLKKAAESMELIHVPQGYTKCNTVIVNETAIITSDQGIAKACEKKMDVLVIETGHVLLPGFPYGFLGGASGKIDETVFFHGDLSSHPDYKKIATFIHNRDLNIYFSKEYPLTDIGSILWHCP